jgi:glucosamine-6-phosphate deaminase
MKVHISPSKAELGRRAANEGAELICQAIAQRGAANIVVATGASQFEMLDSLVRIPGIAWDKVTAFHLDEYLDLPITHGASFRKYLWERFVSKLAFPLKAFHYINGEDDARAECRRLNQLIAQHPIDVAFVGIGENAHLAFNDPPADFETRNAFVVVTLDEAARKQQLGEGWFNTLADVPRQAISMSCPQIMKSRAIIASVPDRRKARAVKDSVEGPIAPAVPSSIMQKHPQASVFLDLESASLLQGSHAQAEAVAS